MQAVFSLLKTMRQQCSEIESGTFRLVVFYERRIRRIIPALSVVYLFCGFICWHIFLPTDFMEFGKSLVASAGFMSNLFFYRKVGYFDSPSHYKPLLHTWSLSVEEQFYVFWPLLLLLLYRVTKRQLLPLIVFSLAIVSLGIAEAQLQWGDKSLAAFYLMPGRAWELLLGAFLALRQPHIPRSGKGFFVVMGLVAVIVPLFVLTSLSRFPGLAALPVCVGTALLLWVGRENHIHWLSSRPLVFVGKVSYSFYLWHWPLFALARYSFGKEITPLNTLALLLLSFVSAVLSWFWVEQPCRRSKRKEGVVPWRLPIGAGIGVLSLAAFFGAIVIIQNGFPERMPIVAELEKYTQETNRLQKDCHWTKGKGSEMSYDAQCRFGNLSESGTKFDLLVIGDSHADAIAPALIQAAENLGLSGFQMTAGGCLPLRGIQQVWNSDIEPSCDQYRNHVWDALKRLRRGGTVVIAVRWAVYAETTFTENEERYYLIENSEDERSSERSLAVMKKALKETAEALSLAGFHVVLVGPVPEMPSSQIACYADAVYRHMDVANCEVRTASFEQRQSRVREAFASIEDLPVKIFWISDFLCGHETCTLAIDGTYLYRDTDHLNPSGALKFSKQFEEILMANAIARR
jgi:peptidoglycan/LPS O-acetylase OafA/YrhL